MPNSLSSSHTTKMSKHHPPASATTITPEDYSHSPVHYAVAVADHSSLSRLVSNLPRLADPSQIHTESDSLVQERLSDKISAVLDRRDNPQRETPLHLAVRINDAFATRTLAVAGADISLQNAAGWNALQEAVCRRCSEIIVILVQHHHIAAWSKWRRRLPRLLSGLRRMRDFYMEISFHFESSIVPFVGKIAPSDTYKIWKRDGNLRADTSLAGYDGLKIQRANQSFLFLGDGDYELNIPSGSLLVLNHDDRRIFDAFENAGAPLSDSEIAGFCAQTSVYRPGMDVTKAELVARTNWRRQEKVESVGEWKARVYEVNNVLFSFRSRKIAGGDGDFAGSEQILPLELDDDADEGFLVAENPRFSVSDNQRRHSSFVGTERELVTVSRKSVDIIPERRRPQASLTPFNERDLVSVSRKSADIRPERRRPPQPCLAPVGERDFVTVSRRSVDIIPQRQRPLPPYLASVGERESVIVSRKSVDIIPTRRRPPPYATPVTVVPPETKEKEYSKSLKPSVWLTDNFPLKTEELLPLLDILANKVKAVRRMRELLTTKFPPGTFPVKVSIPVVPTVRVVITFTKFVELQPLEKFYTPLSSPQHFNQGKGGCEEDETESSNKSSSSTISSSSWLSRSSSKSSSSTNKQQHRGAMELEPFAIPDAYSWSSFDDKSRRMKKSKSSSKNK